MRVNLAFLAVLSLAVAGTPLADEPSTEPRPPDMMDVLGRYQLELPTGWKIQGTNKRLNGFVIGNGTESFVAVYKDGSFTLGDVVPTIKGLCDCPVPDDVTSEIVEKSAYPSTITTYFEDDETLVIGGSVFPDGMFGMIAVLKDRAALLELKSVLAKARPGPSRSS